MGPRLVAVEGEGPRGEPTRGTGRTTQRLAYATPPSPVSPGLQPTFSSRRPPSTPVTGAEGEAGTYPPV